MGWQMTGDAERTPVAERMARLRRRRREGLHPINIDIRQNEIRALVASGLLAAERCDDPRAISGALGRFLDRTLGKS